VKAWLLGSGGWMPTPKRATTSVVIRDRERALAIDAGTGVSRLVTIPQLLEGVHSVDILLTHFHLDHVCGLLYLPALRATATVWAPGRWLYGRASDEILAGILHSPVAPFTPDELPSVRELAEGGQRVGPFEVVARAQLRHWAPTAGFRVGDALAVITDTAYDPGAVDLADGVGHLLHEAWSSIANPLAVDNDSSGRDAGCVAQAASARRLTLIHLNPLLTDHEDVLSDARTHFPTAQLGEDGAALLK
jgi:ribonuclease BN (tRNA processing enzyme)